MRSVNFVLESRESPEKQVSVRLPPRLHSGFAQGRLSTTLASLRSGRDDRLCM